MERTEQKVKTYLEERGWDNLRPVDLAKSIMIEGAELLEIFQWENRSLEEVRNSAEKIEKIKKELADVMIYCFEMATLLNLDTQKIIEDKLDHAAKKYPADLMRKNAKAESGSGEDSEYWRIQKEYRQKGD